VQAAMGDINDKHMLQKSIQEAALPEDRQLSVAEQQPPVGAPQPAGGLSQFEMFLTTKGQ
jgi:hypothetical protein